MEMLENTDSPKTTDLRFRTFRPPYDAAQLEVLAELRAILKSANSK
jgi:hypothetical protein